jgi:hypothetical protein
LEFSPHCHNLKIFAVIDLLPWQGEKSAMANDDRYSELALVWKIGQSTTFFCIPIVLF